MLLFILLILNLTLCHGYPSSIIITDAPESTSTETSTNKEVPAALQNEIGFEDGANVGKENSRCNKSIDYSAIIKTIEEINNLRDKSLKTLEMIEHSLSEKEVPTTESSMELNFPMTTEDLSTTTTSGDVSNKISTDAYYTNDEFLYTTAYQDLTSIDQENLINLNQTNDQVNTNKKISVLDDQKSNFTIYNNSTIFDTENSTALRQVRQEMNSSSTVLPVLENQEEEEDDDDEGDGGGLIGAIISGFLGSLSKPDGSVDVNAVVSVIGMLSAPREDGSYDFTGLTNTLMAFFGGDDEDGGGSDVGSFAGGLVAAILKGITRPGAKGAGTFLGNIAKQVLPAISGPAETVEGATTLKPEVDAGGFLGGLLNSLFGEPTKEGSKPISPFHTIKTNIAKFAFSAISSIIGTSSSSSSGIEHKKEKLQYPK